MCPEQAEGAGRAPARPGGLALRRPRAPLILRADLAGIRRLRQGAAAPTHGQACVAPWWGELRPTAASSDALSSPRTSRRRGGERLPVPAGWRFVTRRSTLIRSADVAGIKCLRQRAAAPSHGQAHVALWRGEPRPTAASSDVLTSPRTSRKRGGERLPVPAGWRFGGRRGTLILRAHFAGIRRLPQRSAAPSHGQAPVAPWRGEPRPTNPPGPSTHRRADAPRLTDHAIPASPPPPSRSSPSAAPPRSSRAGGGSLRGRGSCAGGRGAPPAR